MCLHASVNLAVEKEDKLCYLWNEDFLGSSGNESNSIYHIVHRLHKWLTWWLQRELLSEREKIIWLLLKVRVRGRSLHERPTQDTRRRPHLLPLLLSLHPALRFSWVLMTDWERRNKSQHCDLKQPNQIKGSTNTGEVPSVNHTAETGLLLPTGKQPKEELFIGCAAPLASKSGALKRRTDYPKRSEARVHP